MGKTKRKFNSMYNKYKQSFKGPLENVGKVIRLDFSDRDFINLFKEMYPYMWEDLNKKYDFWHYKNNDLIRKGKKSRYNFRNPTNFVLDCSKGIRKKAREGNYNLNEEEKVILKEDICRKSKLKVERNKQKLEKELYYIQEVSPEYEKAYISKYFKSHDLHIKLEIIRELSKYKSKNIIKFFYKVNYCTRNFSLKQESKKYIQSLQLPFQLRGKKKGKKNYIDNEIVKNESSPEELEKLKKFDIFMSHNSLDKQEIIKIRKLLNKDKLVAYIDWSSDKFDLRHEWCNATTSHVIKERIKQSKCIMICMTKKLLKSQWCPWEIGYADAIGKKICIYKLEDISYIPQFFDSYYEVKIIDNEFIVEQDNKKVKLNDWITNKSN